MDCGIHKLVGPSWANSFDQGCGKTPVADQSALRTASDSMLVRPEPSTNADQLDSALDQSIPRSVSRFEIIGFAGGSVAAGQTSTFEVHWINRANTQLEAQEPLGMVTTGSGERICERITPNLRRELRIADQSQCFPATEKSR